MDALPRVHVHVHRARAAADAEFGVRAEAGVHKVAEPLEQLLALRLEVRVVREAVALADGERHAVAHEAAELACRVQVAPAAKDEHPPAPRRPIVAAAQSGRVLVQVVRHVLRALEQRDDVPRADALERATEHPRRVARAAPVHLGEGHAAERGDCRVDLCEEPVHVEAKDRRWRGLVGRVHAVLFVAPAGRATARAACGRRRDEDAVAVLEQVIDKASGQLEHPALDRDAPQPRVPRVEAARTQVLVARHRA
mmetsp:Transcript_24898/g.63107  ORF Transcript_24898/g.63107 Transcript_24898/m.63107 type:complete len:253 (-) Transcript_24898:129-887(-)